MMKKLNPFAIVVVLSVGLCAPTAFADSHAAGFEQAVKARQALMVLRTFNLGQLGAMAKGSVEYDAANATAVANDLAALSRLNQKGLWPQGSDNVAMPGVSRARLEIWTTYPKVAELGKAFAAATASLAANAGTDLAALRAGVGAVGKACTNCHEAFRAKKK